MNAARLITLEGTEGVGKTTNLEFIQRFFAERGESLRVTREPGGTPLAEELRELLLRVREEKVSPKAELLMMFAARAQHLEHVILPALAAGQWVLCDRFTDATFAYQGGGRQHPLKEIEALETLVQGDLRPGLVLVLDVPVELGLARAASRSCADRFESEQLEFFERVRAQYRARCRQYPKTHHLIDASRPLEDVQRTIGDVLLAHWQSHAGVASHG